MAEISYQYNNNYDLSKVGGYNLMSYYFDNPLMTKVKIIENGLSLYAVAIKSLLNENRYIIALVRNDINKIGEKVYMNNLEWENLQIRILSEEYPNINNVSYNVKKDTEFQQKINLIKRHDKTSEYIYPQFNFVITLINNDHNRVNYANNPSFLSAIETYQTLISFN